MRVTRGAALAIAGVLAAASLAACSSSSGGGSPSKAKPAATVLNVGMPNGSQTDNNNPFLGSSAGASLGYRFMIFEPLVMTNAIAPSQPGKPWLATKWTWANNYEQLTLNIRDGVKWSDGSPLTGDDVAYTFQLMKDHSALNFNALTLGGITATGNTVVLTFPSSQFVNQTKILSQFVVQKAQWSALADPATDALKSPIGTGPYTLKSFTAQTVTLGVRTSGYWQKAPAPTELRYTSYTDNDSQTTALANGACEWSFTFIPNPKAVYQSKDPAHNQLWFPPTLGIHGLWFNTTKAPMNDANLRKAIGMVINRADIFSQGEAGYFYPQVTNPTGIPTPAGSSYIASQYASLTTNVDVAGAKTLLTQNGYTYAGSTLKDKTGKPVTITLSDPSGWSDYQTDLEIIKDNLSQIGITAKIDKANQDAWFKNVDTGNFDAVLHWTNNGATPYDIYQNIMDGADYKPVGTGGVAGNYGRYQNPAATAALKSYANASDDASRTTALNTLEGIMVNEEPMVPLMAANGGAEYVTTHWVGWPSAANPYAPAQPTLLNSLDIVMHLTPAK
jgi:peptide/nickel transport system substrate-binding protein